MGYRFGSVFCARVAGVPFEVLEDLGTPHVAALARRLIELDDEIARATAIAHAELAERELGRPIVRRARKAMSRREPLPADVPDGPGCRAYRPLLDELVRARSALDDRLRSDAEEVRRRLWTHAHAHLPDFLVIESESAYLELRRYLDGAAAERRRKDRYTELFLARYLQRVCAKNDTISRFGPATWGRVDAAGSGFELRLTPGVARRHVTVERWVVAAVVAAINADPAVRGELYPRVHPNGRVEGAMFVRLDTGAEHALDASTIALVARCDGRTPAFELGVARVDELARAGVVIASLELVAWDRDPLATLIEDLGRWRDGEPKQRWLPRVLELAELAQRFGADPTPEARLRANAGVRAIVEAVAGAPPSGSTLYQASNPILEECARDPGVVVGDAALDRVREDIAPWLDLFSDTYALAASWCYRRLGELHTTAPRRGGAVSLAAFAAHCDAGGVQLHDSGLAKLARAAFGQAKADFREALSARADAPEWQLTRDDCHVLRRKYALPAAPDNGWACPDMQIAARSADDVARGDCTWVVAELHGVSAPLQRALELSCPDRAALHDVYRGGGPWLIPSRLGFFASVHVALEAMVTTIPNAVFCAPERPRPGWRVVPPSETEVVVDHDRHDIRVRARGTGEDLGSLVRTPWMVLGGLHPFFPLEIAPHTPRLRLGSTIVQRRTWRIARAEVGDASPRGDVAAPQIVAVERLRGARGIPRWVFVRPAGGTLERTAVTRRDRDVKPMYIDLESTLFLEIFFRYLHKYGELDVVEMLPAPDQLCWREADGRYSFELRMMCPPTA